MAVFANTFAGNPLDRASERRTDAEWLIERAAGGASEAVVFRHGEPLLSPDGRGLARIQASMAAELAGGPADLLFLGLAGARAVFAVELPAGDEGAGLEPVGRFANLRDAAMLLEAAEAAIAAEAKALLEWARRCAFCATCGGRNQVEEAGWKRVCTVCRTQHFPRTDPVVIMLPVRGDRCLLGRQAAWAPGRFSALAGFAEPGESIEEACAREVREEAGLRVASTTYHSSQPWPFPANLMIGLIAEVEDGEARPDQTELEAVRWFSRAEARALLAGELEPELTSPPPLAIAHQLIRTWAAG